MANQTDLTNGVKQHLDQIARTLEKIDARDRSRIVRIVEELLEEQAERDALRGQLAALRAELMDAKKTIAETNALVAQMRKERERLEANHDAYLKAVYALLPKDEITFTEEELADLRQNGVTLDSVIQEIEHLKGA